LEVFQKETSLLKLAAFENMEFIFTTFEVSNTKVELNFVAAANICCIFVTRVVFQYNGRS